MLNDWYRLTIAEKKDDDGKESRLTISITLRAPPLKRNSFNLNMRKGHTRLNVDGKTKLSKEETGKNRDKKRREK